MATLVGGLIAFLTLRAQLRHEAREKERERKLSLRRDVYLETVGEIGRAQLFLSSFSRQDVDLPSLLDHLQQVPAALSRAQLVASQQTFDALEGFGEFLLGNMMNLLALKLRVNHLQNEIDQQNDVIEQLKRKHAYAEAGFRPEEPSLGQGKTELPSLPKQIIAAYERLGKLTQKQVEITEKLGRETIKATLDAQVEAGRVNLQIRKEIELPLNEALYLERLKGRAARVQPKVDELYKDVDRIFEETESL